MKVYQPKNDKDRMIARQSQLKFSQDFVNSNQYPASIKDLVALTELMCDYVINGYTKELGTKFDEMTKYFEEKKSKKK